MVTRRSPGVPTTRPARLIRPPRRSARLGVLRSLAAPGPVRSGSALDVRSQRGGQPLRPCASAEEVVVQVERWRWVSGWPDSSASAPSSPSAPIDSASDSSRATTGADATAAAISSWISLSCRPRCRSAGSRSPDSIGARSATGQSPPYIGIRPATAPGAPARGSRSRHGTDHRAGTAPRTRSRSTRSESWRTGRRPSPSPPRTSRTSRRGKAPEQRRQIALLDPGDLAPRPRRCRRGAIRRRFGKRSAAWVSRSIGSSAELSKEEPQEPKTSSRTRSGVGPTRRNRTK